MGIKPLVTCPHLGGFMKMMKKRFAVWDFDEEIQFLQDQARQGWMLEKVDSKYYFKKFQPQALDFAVDFFIEPLTTEERLSYFDAGYRMVCDRKSQEGYWTYWTRPASEADPIIHKKGRRYLLIQARDRIARFHLPILIFLALVMIYHYLQTGQFLYGILILLASPVMVFLGAQYVKLDRLVKMFDYDS